MVLLVAGVVIAGCPAEATDDATTTSGVAEETTEGTRDPSQGASSSSTAGVSASSTTVDPSDGSSSSSSASEASSTSTGTEMSVCGSSMRVEPNDTPESSECIHAMDHEVRTRTLDSRDDVDLYCIDMSAPLEVNSDTGNGLDWLEVDINQVDTMPVAVPEQSYPLTITIYDAGLEPLAVGHDSDQEPIASDLPPAVYYAEIRFSDDLPEGVEQATYTVVIDNLRHGTGSCL